VNRHGRSSATSITLPAFFFVNTAHNAWTRRRTVLSSGTAPDAANQSSMSRTRLAGSLNEQFVERQVENAGDTLDHVVARWLLVAALDPAPVGGGKSDPLGKLNQAVTLLLAAGANDLAE
jgi:hypothetical protein